MDPILHSNEMKAAGSVQAAFAQQGWWEDPSSLAPPVFGSKGAV